MNKLVFTVFAVLFVVQSGTSYQCQKCDPRVDIQCQSPTLETCFSDASPTIKLMMSHYKPACMTLEAFSILGFKIIAKNCVIDLSDTGMDQCDIAKKVAMKASHGTIHNITCSICKEDLCNGGPVTKVTQIDISDDSFNDIDDYLQKE